MARIAAFCSRSAKDPGRLSSGWHESCSSSEMPLLRTLLLLSLACAASALASASAWAHGGGLDKNGCHHDRKNGGYHCHRSPAAPRPQTYAPPAANSYIPSTRSSGWAYRNCDEARAAGAAPVRRGQPGYGPHLDRDNDGIGCEPSNRSASTSGASQTYVPSPNSLALGTSTWWTNNRSSGASKSPPYMSHDEGIEALGRLSARLQRNDPFYEARYPILIQQIKKITASTPVFYWVREVENAYWNIPATKQSVLVGLQEMREPTPSSAIDTGRNTAVDADGLTAAGILSVGKMAGACGILDSLIHFQKTTRMEGGDAFVMRFWEVEATRLGLTAEDLSNKCDQAVTSYDRLWEVAEGVP